jgi:dGTPase
MFNLLFNRYVRDMEENNPGSIIFRDYLRGMSKEYREESHPAEIVRDFIAGMTDQYFLRQCPEEMHPPRITAPF